MKYQTVVLISLSLVFAVALCSCRRGADSKQDAEPKILAARNLTPGLSEELTAFADKNKGVGFVFLVDRSGGSEEARDFVALMTKALKDGGWPIIRNEEVDKIARDYEPVRGIVCGYSKGHERVAEDLVSLLKQKGLRIDCQQSNAPMPMINIEVGLNQ